MLQETQVLLYFAAGLFGLAAIVLLRSAYFAVNHRFVRTASAEAAPGNGGSRS